ncbi:hypothetical protein JW905_12325, partial [bacterium]|nr:hypothetical protein [candidate division CSSED10-310 bacterium]
MTPDRRRRVPLFAACCILLGATGLIEQTLLVRELLCLFTGTELTMGMALGGWLFWSGAGSLIIRRRRRQTELARLCQLLLLQGVTGLAAVLFCRIAPRLLNIPAGCLPGITVMILMIMSVMAAPGLIAGLLFVLASRAVPAQQGDNGHERYAANRVYWLEGTGAAMGGLAASAGFMLHLPAVTMALIVLSAGAAMTILVNLHSPRAIAWSAFLLIGSIVLAIHTPLEELTLALRHSQEEQLLVRESPYARIELYRRGSQFSLYLNGALTATRPNQALMEE